MKHLLSSLFLSLALLLLPLSSTSEITPTAAPTGPTGTIYRTTKQQILASILPGVSSPTTPFLTSPSGKYTAVLLRTPTAPGAGGFGNDFCIVQIQETETHQSLWESECAPVSTSNACTLVFDDAGLEVFDGINSVYNTAADGDHVNVLELVDQGDMRILDKEGELAWKASDEPRGGQGCRLPGSVGMAPETPPFAGVIGGGSGTGPFGQQVGSVVGQGGQQEEEVGGEPLVDSSVYDSGCEKGVEVFGLGVGLVVAVAWFVIGV